jgi:hypothetical protein
VFTSTCETSAQPWPDEIPARICSAKYLQKTIVVDGFSFHSFKNDASGEACLQIVKGRNILFQRTNDNNGWFTLGQQSSEDGSIAAIKDGIDITGMGRPNVVVSQWTGGAHCCRVDYVFELRPHFRLLAKLDAEHSDEAHFADLEGDRRYYYLASDWTFAYWLGSFAGSPAHDVVLRFVEDKSGGRYRLALDKMARPAPDKKQWSDAFERVNHELQLEKDGMANDLSHVLWQQMLDFIYTGHADLSWKFLKELGPDVQRPTYPDLGDFCSRLKTSIYWSDLRKTMQDAPPTCRNAKSEK